VSLRAFIQQRIRHVYRRQRPTPLLRRTAKRRRQSQLGVDGLDVAHAELRSAPWGSTSHRSTLLIVFVLEMVSSRKQLLAPCSYR
jgi:hypothetical protein